MIRIFLNSPVGGSGCTTFSANLAYAFSRLGQNVLLTGMQDESMSMHFEGLNSNEARPPTPMQGDTKNILSNLQVRITGERQDKVPAHTTRSIANGANARQQSSKYDIKIFDRIHVSAEEPLTESDWMLLVTNSTANCYRQLSGYLAAMYGDNLADYRGRVMTVLNQHVPESVLSADILDLMSNSLQESLFSGIFVVDELIRESAANGLPLVEYAPYSANQPLFDQLANHLITQQDKHHAAA